MADALVEGTSREGAGELFCAHEGGVIDASRVHGIGGHGAGIMSTGPSFFRGRDVWIEGVVTSTYAERPFHGFGIVATQGGRVELDRIQIERVHDAGLAVDSAATASVSDAVFRDVRAAYATAGQIARVNTAGRVTLSRVSLDRATSGLNVADPGSSATIEDLIAVAPSTDGEATVRVSNGAELTVRRAVISETGRRGIEMSDDASIALHDLRYLGSESNAFCFYDYGTAIIGRSVFAGCSNGIYIGPIAEARISDLDMIGVVGTSTEPAIALSIDGTFELDRGRISDTRGIAIRSTRDARPALRDVIVRRVNDSVALLVFGSMTLKKAVIEDIESRALFGDGDQDRLLTIEDLAVRRAGETALSRFQLTSASKSGVLLRKDASFAGNPELDLAQGVIARSPVGLDVEAPGFDLNRVIDRVAIEECGLPIRVP